LKCERINKDNLIEVAILMLHRIIFRQWNHIILLQKKTSLKNNNINRLRFKREKLRNHNYHSKICFNKKGLYKWVLLYTKNMKKPFKRNAVLDYTRISLLIKIFHYHIWCQEYNQMNCII
jgi:hypothetical protein